jgi:hypothetical protein
LGVVLYELLTGSLPDAAQVLSNTISSTNGKTVCVAAEAAAATSSTSVFDECPVGLRDILVRCLSPDALDRPQSAEFVARRLQICASRDLHGFVFAPAGSWASALSKHPILAFVAVALAPNAFLAALNIAFVDQYVSGGFYLAVPPSWTVPIGYFVFQKIVVNAIVFPLGICAMVALARPVVRALQAVAHSYLERPRRPVPSAASQATWQYAARLGYYVWLVAMGCWIATGFVFPTWNCLAKLHYTQKALSTQDFATFFMTQVTFGCMASALSVLGISYVLTNCLLPMLVRGDYVPSASCLEPIANQVRRSVHWLAFLPQFSLLAVALLIADRNPVLLAMLGLVSGGCYACGILYARSIRRAEDRLRTLLAPTQVLLYGDQAAKR